MIKRILKISLYAFALVLSLVFVVTLYLYHSTDMAKPELTIDIDDYKTDQRGDTLFSKTSYLYQNEDKIWELFIKGSNQDRGAIQGVLTADLMRYQEDVFINQIRNIIPSDSYLSFLHFFITLFNRDLGQHIPLEYRNEIMAMSEFCTHDYDAIGTPYERQLNYHAAHDIGHTMQQYMLVACSAFATWGQQSEDGELIIGRNFDFFVGYDFAKNKMLTFAAPDTGYKYVSASWAGMVGVLSGMNEKGITVSINAAKGSIPTSATVPVSILVREILQYASSLDEAYAIAEKRKLFVSESILIGSGEERRAMVIEKTPDATARYDVEGERLALTNHFQSDFFKNDVYNIENIENSDSKHRHDRIIELLDQNPKLNPQSTANILRDRLGLGGEDIGIGNEMTLNQSIAHHSVIFQPHKNRIWLSTSPWQSGKMLCYDLNDFFSHGEYPCALAEYDIAEDSLFIKKDYPSLLAYRSGIKKIKLAMKDRKPLGSDFIDDFQTYNPNHYYTYRLLGDYYTHFNEQSQAIVAYRKALACKIPYKSERKEIEQYVNQ